MEETNIASGGINQTLISQESFEGTWPPSLPSDWTETGRWNRESNDAYEGTYSADFDGAGSGALTTCDLDCAGASTAIYVSFWYRDEGCEPTELLLQYYNGTAWNGMVDLGSTTIEYQWLHYEEKITSSQYFVPTFKIRLSASGVDGNEHFYVDYVTVKKEVNVNYELDLEVQWTNIEHEETNEWLCIYAETIDSEDIRVDAWNGTSWNDVIADLSNGWNNVSASPYLVSSEFTMRFKDGAVTDDTRQDSWNIDAVLLHVWSERYISEVEFIGTSTAIISETL